MPRFLLSYSLAKERLASLSFRDFINARSIGFALARAWVYLLFMGTAASTITWSGAALPHFVFVVSAICLSVTLLTCGLLHRTFTRVFEQAPVRYAGPLMMTAGTLLLAFSVFSPALTLPFGILGSVFTGIGSGIINLAWGEAYKQIDPLKTLCETPLSFMIAALFVPVFTVVDPRVCCLLCALLPLVSGWILFAHLKVWAKPPLVQPSSLKSRPFAWKIGLSACLLSLADSVVRTVFQRINQFNHGGEPDSVAFSLVWASILALFIFYLCTLFAQKLNYGFMIKPVLLIMALFYLLLPVVEANVTATSIIAQTGYDSFNLLIWILLAQAARNYRLSSIAVFGVGWGMVTLGMFLGSLASMLLDNTASFLPQELSLIALLATIAVLFSYMFILNENDLVELSAVAEEQTPDNTRTRPFQTRCKELAQEYELSAKETEIMILVAKGRSAPRIQEDLFLSRGTVTTHTRHIYQKMNIHDKQQLLDLIEGIEPR